MRNDHDEATFGALLRAFRTRRRVTQQQLATAVGLHRSAIGRWEQGDFLPATRGMVLELARHLALDDSEARRLLEASLTAIAPSWDVPLPRNPYFTGREAPLEALHACLSTEQAVALTQSYALHGLGGIGKTQIALEYAYRYGLEYHAVLWVEAETDERVASSLLRIAETLQLPERKDVDQSRVMAGVRRWLSNHHHWLLIWDNLDDLKLLYHFLPTARQGAVLITTRGTALGTFAVGLDLLPMDREEGMLLVLRRAKVLERTATVDQLCQLARRSPAEAEAAEELVTLLGGLPLALDQAGAYMEETGCSLADYVQRYQQQQACLLARRGGGGEQHPQSVSTTFQLSIKQVEQEQRAAAELLRACAFLHAESIPEELFAAGAAHLGLELEALAADATQFDHAVAVLLRLSLVQRQAETHTLSLHRLVQAVLRESLTEQEQAAWLKRMVVALSAAFPEVMPQNAEGCERLISHVLTVARAIPEGAEDQKLTEILKEAAKYLYNRAHYEQAEQSCLRVLRIERRIWGSEHLKSAEAICDLAYVYYEQGQYQRAEPLCRHALRIREQALGLAHFDLARPLHQLGLISWKQGDYKQAEQVYQRACSILEQATEPEHLHQKAVLLNCLAILAAEQGQEEQAERLYWQALALREQLGPERPLMAACFNNLAELYCNQGRYEQAEAFYQRAQTIWQQILGPEHPDVAHPLNGLANVYTKQGEYKRAEPLYQRALSIREERLGRDHPETAQTLHDLAGFWQQQGRFAEALACAERALLIRSQTLGDAHPLTVETRTLHHQLLQGQTCAQKEALAALSTEEISDAYRNGHNAERRSPSLREGVKASPSEDDPLQGFLAACCELHPHAWSQASELWQAYECWVKQHCERFPLSRRVFAGQLKAHGCRNGRTNTARIWRGIALVKRDP